VAGNRLAAVRAIRDFVAQSIRITATASGGKYVVADEIEIIPGIIPPARYPELLKLESSLQRKAAKVFLLEQD